MNPTKALSVPQSIAALAWLDYKSLARRAAALLHNPRRGITMIFWLGFIGLQLAQRALGRPTGALVRLPAALQLLIPGATIVALGAIVGIAERAPLARFASRGEAHFLIGSGLNPRGVVGWLIVRRAAANLWRLPFILIAISMMFGLSGRWLTARGAWLLGALWLFATVATAISMPAFVASRHGFPVRKLSLVTCTVGLVAMGAVLTGPRGALHSTFPLPRRLAFAVALAERLPPGNWLAAAARGSVASFALAALLAAVLVVASAASVVDIYPEMWSASQLRFARLDMRGTAGRRMGTAERKAALRLAARQAWGGGSRRTKNPAGPVSPPVLARNYDWLPKGVSVIAWKEFLATLRGGGVRSLAIMTTLALLMGVAAGLYTPPHARPGIVPLIVYFVVIRAAPDGWRVGEEMRQPLWWTAGHTLRSRLAAWSLASAGRDSILAVLTLTGAAVAGGSLLLASLIPLLAVVPWLARTAAITANTAIPGSASPRGPGVVLVLLFMMLAAVIPLVATAAVAAAGYTSPGILLGAVLAGAETWPLLTLATRRIHRLGAVTFHIPS